MAALSKVMVLTVHGSEPGDFFLVPLPARSYTAEVGADPGKLRIGILTRTSSFEAASCLMLSSTRIVGNRWLTGEADELCQNARNAVGTLRSRRASLTDVQRDGAAYAGT